MRSRVRALFDVEPLRAESRATLGLLTRDAPTVVLGSRQDHATLAAASLARDDVEVRRRRGGGGAVLLRPPDCWAELWLPASRIEAPGDVRATAWAVGECWALALDAVGVRADVHRGEMLDAHVGSVACFAGLGPGEVSVAGRKLVGLSQWRCREGVLVSTVLSAGPPSDLAAYLVAPPEVRRALRGATSLRAVAPRASRVDVAGAFARAVAAAMGPVRLDAAAFS